MAPTNATRGKKRPVAKAHALKEAAANSQKASRTRAIPGNTAAATSAATSVVSVPTSANADVSTTPAHFRGTHVSYFLLLITANSPDGGIPQLLLKTSLPRKMTLRL
jgi:hypothetical protein